MVDGDFDKLRDRVGYVEREIAAHKAACEERHKEIQRRFEAADHGRSGLRAEMTAGFGELRGRFDTAHSENRAAISHVERGGLERSLDVAKAILMACLAGALGYFLKGGH